MFYPNFLAIVQSQFGLECDDCNNYRFTPSYNNKKSMVPLTICRTTAMWIGVNTVYFKENSMTIIQPAVLKSHVPDCNRAETVTKTAYRVDYNLSNH